MRQVIYLANAVDEADLSRTFAALDRRDIQARRVDPRALSLSVDGDGRPKLFDEESEIAANLVVGWAFEEELAPGAVLLDALTSLGVPVLNGGWTLLRGQNKLLMSVILLANGVPHLPVTLVGDLTTAKRLREKTSFPVVLKAPFVSCSGITRLCDGGASVVRAMDGNALMALAELSLSFRHPLYAQPFVEKPGRIIDANVIGYELCTATYKYAAPGEWRTNVARGATRFEDCTHAAEIRDLAVAAAKALQAPIAGVNIAEVAGRPVVIEVNTCPTFGQYERLYGNLLYDAVAGLVESTCNAQRSVLCE